MGALSKRDTVGHASWRAHTHSSMSWRATAGLNAILPSGASKDGSLLLESCRRRLLATSAPSLQLTTANVMPVISPSFKDVDRDVA